MRGQGGECGRVASGTTALDAVCMYDVGKEGEDGVKGEKQWVVGGIHKHIVPIDHERATARVTKLCDQCGEGIVRGASEHGAGREMSMAAYNEQQNREHGNKTAHWSRGEVGYAEGERSVTTSQVDDDDE